MLDASLDPQTERVWLALLKGGRLLEIDLPQELRMQVISDEWVGAPLPDNDAVPVKFALLPAYPNPFNSTTTISYNLPVQSPVCLQIYNLRGQLVDVLLDGVMPAGMHSMVWDGDGLSAGVYLLSIGNKFGKKTAMQKISFSKNNSEY